MRNTLVLFLSILYFSFCFHINTVSSESIETDTVFLKLKWKHQFQFAGYYAAIEKGFFKDAGLHVVLLEADGNEEPTICVAVGNAQYGIAASDLLLARNKGLPLVLLANIFQHSPQVFLSTKLDDVGNIHDLAGKSIMLEEHAAELIAYLKMEQIPIKGINHIAHTYNPQSLIDNDVFAMSAYSTDEPFLLDLAGKEYHIHNPRSSGIDFYGDILFTSENEINKHPERVKAFLDATLKGWEYALNNKEEIIDIIYNKYSKRHSIEHLKFEAKQTQRLIMPDVIEIGYVNEGRWQRISEIYAELLMLPKDFSLKGFIYERNPKPNLKTTYIILVATIILSMIIALIALRFYRLNEKLKTESKKREEQDAHLILMEKEYRNLAENAPYPIIIASSDDGKILYLNNRACEKFEITANYALQQNAKMIYVNPDDRLRLIEKLDKHGYVNDSEFLLTTASKKEFGALISSNLITFEEKPALFSAILDISDRIKLENEIKQANEDKNQLFSIIAHDLRGPLGNFQALVDLLVENHSELSQEEKYDILLRLKKSSNSTYNLLENLLMWSLSQKDEMSFNPTNNKVYPIIIAIRQLYSENISTKKINLEVKCDKNLESVFDKDMLSITVRNLINNAIKYTKQHGEIIISAYIRNNELNILVQDNGIGLDSKTQENLFTIQNKAASKTGTAGEKGSGLGLVLCYEFVQKHGGNIKVNSKEGLGSLFTISIPC